MSLILGILAQGVAGAGAGNSYESIATVTVGSGGSSAVTFSSIPSDYTHLQIRGISQTNRSSYVIDQLYLRFNSDTGSNYAYHTLFGGLPSSPVAATLEGSSQTAIKMDYPNSGVSANVFTALIIDILDYKNTNKYKTARNLFGFDCNGTAGTGSYGGTVSLNSGLWMNTNAITSIDITTGAYSSLINQYSHFALYGIKGS